MSFWELKRGDVNMNIRIGTRDSRLAMAQAVMVENLLLQSGHNTAIYPCKSMGDKRLDVPLYEMGIQGIFTRELDQALLNNEIDIAVHSLKDVPTSLAKGIRLAAILPRASCYDVLIARDEESIARIRSGEWHRIGTSSIRRKAQWLHRYPAANFEILRGNVPTRLSKLHQAKWDGIILAEAGLQRLGMTEAETGPWWRLDWMQPAPAQGAIAVVCRESEESLLLALQTLHHHETAICVTVEREFLRLMQGGCSMPVSGVAVCDNESISFSANITASDGKASLANKWNAPASEAHRLASEAAEWMKQKGADKLMKS